MFHSVVYVPKKDAPYSIKTLDGAQNIDALPNRYLFSEDELFEIISWGLVPGGQSVRTRKIIERTKEIISDLKSQP